MAVLDAELSPDDVVTLSADRLGDPDGTKLYAALDAHLAYQRARTARRLWIFLLAATGVAAWLLGIFPTALVPLWVSTSVAAACVAVVLGAATAALMEWYRFSRWTRAASERGLDSPSRAI